jgi:hypothetical protein
MSDAPPQDPTSSETVSPEEIPLGQRLCDSPFVLLVLCAVVMFVFFTGWGLWEMFTLPEAPLP